MAELPELTILQEQMDAALSSQRITMAEITQPKCLNVPIKKAAVTLVGKRIIGVTRKGKWLCLNLAPEQHLLLNLGMGADLWHYSQGTRLPAKYQLRIELENGNGFTCRFWWFGHVHLLSSQQLAKHRQTAQIGPSPMEVTPRQLIDVARQYPRSTAKSLIVDQEKLAGIGNAYAHDILWKAGLHPQRKLATLSDEELTRYHGAIRYVMRRAIDKGGLEKDFHQRQGNLESVHELFLIGYKEGKPCPQCRAHIKKIRTGGTATFICPTCQPSRPAGKAMSAHLRRNDGSRHGRETSITKKRGNHARITGKGRMKHK